MTPEALAELHALCFTETPRPWSAAEFASLIPDTSILLLSCPQGFALGQIAGPEVTLLTLAVHPAHRRQGLAQRLLQDFETRARARGAIEAFLEVAETNHPARALYAALGYVGTGRRRGYYPRGSLPAIDAIVLRKALDLADQDNPGKII